MYFKFVLLSLLFLISCSTVGDRLAEEAYIGNLDMVKTLSEKGQKNDARNDKGWTALMAASESGEMLVVKYLLDTEANPNLRNALGDTAMHRATVRGNLEVIRSLHGAGAYPNLRNESGATPLMKAVEEGTPKHKEIISFLVSAGANINDRDFDGNTALARAVKKQNADMVKFLIGLKADPKAENKFGEPPMLAAKEAKNREIIEILRSAGAK